MSRLTLEYTRALTSLVPRPALCLRPQLHYSAMPRHSAATQPRPVSARGSPARPGPACLPAVCHHTLQPLTTTTPRLQHPHTTCSRYLDSAWLRQGRDPARLSLGLGHSTVGPTVSPRSRLHSGQQPCPRPPGSRMSPPGAGQCVSLVRLYVLSLL